MPRALRVPPDEFIKIWQMGRTLSEVAEACKATRRWASQTASNFRRKGVMLKHFPRGMRYDYDWKKFKKLAHKYRRDNMKEAL